MKIEMVELDQCVLHLIEELHCSPALSPAPLYGVLAAEWKPSFNGRERQCRTKSWNILVWGFARLGGLTKAEVQLRLTKVSLW